MLIGAGIAAVLFLIFIYYIKEELDNAIKVVFASAEFVGYNKRVIIVPNLHFIVLILVIMAWLFGTLNVCSLNKIEVGDSPQSRYMIFETKYKFWLAFMFFGLYWTFGYVVKSSRFIITVSASTYYFKNSKKNMGEKRPAEIMTGVIYAYLYHNGSIAFGAFFSFFVKVLRWLIYYPLIKCCLLCCREKPEPEDENE